MSRLPANNHRLVFSKLLGREGSFDVQLSAPPYFRHLFPPSCPFAPSIRRSPNRVQAAYLGGVADTGVLSYQGIGLPFAPF
jgi:hypothetical protein